MELAIQVSPEQLALAWEQHLIRTRNMITQYRAKLVKLEAIEDAGEQALIEEQIAKWEAQLVRPTDLPEKEASPSLVQQLKAEVSALAAMVKELLKRPSAAPAETVSEPEPAHVG